MEKRVGVGVGILILKDDKVLLGKRYGEPDGKTADGSWCLAGGKLEFGEAIEDCAKREVMEETGMKADDLKLISISNDIVYDKHFITIGFLAKKTEGEPKAMSPDEITTWKWFDINKLPDPMFTPSLRLINNYIKNKIYKGD